MFRRRLLKGLFIFALVAETLSSQADETLLDPTRPPVTVPKAEAGAQPDATPAWRLESTLVSEYRRVAVINGQRVYEDSEIGGARVEKIDRHSVVLKSGGREIVLKKPGRVDVKQRKGT